jgi:AraC family transcriptional regulator
MQNNSGGYDGWMKDRFGLEPIAPISVRCLGQSDIVVTEINVREPPKGLTEPIPATDGFLMTIPPYEVWEGGKRTLTDALAPGVTNFYDLRTSPSVIVKERFHNISFDLPRRALNEIAEAEGVPKIEDFAENWRTGGCYDPVLKNLSLVLKPAFSNPDEVSLLVCNHITLAAAVHALKTYGNAGPSMRAVNNSLLSTQQLTTAYEALRDRLDGRVTLFELGHLCGLSAPQFARAFRRSTGMAPYQWLMMRRIELARGFLLRRPFLPLWAVADLSGFTSARHLVRLFSARVGAHPEAWRRQI